MKRPAELVAAWLPLTLVLALPLAFARSAPHTAAVKETLVVLTPHNEAIRSEFSAAYRRFMKRNFDREVDIDWRTPGGAAEIGRYLAAQYGASFRLAWLAGHHAFTPRVGAAFANPKLTPAPNDTGDEALARRAFLGSSVSSGADVLFGGGSAEFAVHAAAGYLIDVGVVAARPDIFNAAVIPASLGGEPYWDEQGRWIGVCLAGFGICANRDSLDRLARPAPTSWSDLADPSFHGQLALADPSKSGSAAKAFEMLIQQQIQLARVTSSDEPSAVRDGFRAAMRLVRRIAANARYFTDSASKIPLDVGAGDAAAGMCIDFYGRFQSETMNASSRSRLVFVTPRGGSSIGADPVAVLRGAPHLELATSFVGFLLSEEGQKIWSYRVGTPGGPERYALRRLPILPSLYAPEHRAYASDPDARPYEDARAFEYRPADTAPIFRSIAFVVRVMCVDPHDELARAYRALSEHGNPPAALALFDDVSAVDYTEIAGPIRSAVSSNDPSREAELANRLIARFREQYREVARLAEARQ